ncbi:MAG: asparagine synthase (glutamine-hydrolyzing) [Bacteroidia bacterium]|nr:asparagine synthase (glutamine-hydrolyzing) [Bacteroidia bacterium]
MCGIAGYVDFSENASLEIVQKMIAPIAHRGPDATGTYTDLNVGLGHKRLSIIDLSESANQPFWSRDKRFVIVYNGEVYNYQELASKIPYPLRTQSDTEVILEGFAHFGHSFFSQLNGMFALAIWDTHEKCLWLARDPVGIKPLFWASYQKKLFFASEIKSIKAVFNTSDVNLESIANFLYLGFIPGRNTIYREIQRFPQGQFWKISASGIKQDTFFQLSDFIQKTVITEEEVAINQYHEVLKNAVKRQLISDVPVGVFFSAGTDSTLLASLAKSVSSKTINTFTIGFKDSIHNESEYAQKIAKHLGTEHHEFILDSREVLDHFPEYINTYDEPFGDTSTFPMRLVSHLARKYVSVVLSGEGGDEIMLGYGSYLWAEKLQNPIIRAGIKTLLPLLTKYNPNFGRFIGFFDEKIDSKRFKTNLFSQENYQFRQKEIQELFCSSITFSPLQEHWQLARSLTAAEEQAFFDLHYYLPDLLLTKADRCTMQFSLEGRVPFLDLEVLKVALNISPKLKIRGSISKYLSKKVLYQYVPYSLLNHPKYGFALPVDMLRRFLRQELRSLLEETLSPAVVNRYGWLKAAKVTEVLHQFQHGNLNKFNQVWNLFILHQWAKEKL